MNKKKILITTLVIILILISIFFGFTIRKMLIFKNLNQKISKYIDSDNHYEKIINNSNNTKTVTEYYCKGENAVLFLNTTIQSTGETRKLVNYYKGEKTNTYIETEQDKIALLDSNGLPSKIMIINLDYGDNIWNLFQIALATSIKSVEYNGKECYLINLGKNNYYYVEKETGLTLKAKYGTENNSDIIVEYYYEFDNVNDSIFLEPDISQYKIQTNN